MKFNKLVTYADKAGFSNVVTGHYARIEYDEAIGRYLLRKAVDISKDQSYVLYMLTQEQLSKIVFPPGELKKTDVRRIAEKQGFCNSQKHDSQDICFVPDGDYVKFTPGLEKGVEEMCNLSAGIERQGIEKGKSEMIDFIARISKYSKEKIAEIGRLHGLL